MDSLFWSSNLGGNPLFSVRRIDTGGITYFHIRGVTDTVCWVGQKRRDHFHLILLFNRYNRLIVYKNFIRVVYYFYNILGIYNTFFLEKNTHSLIVFNYSLRTLRLIFTQNKVHQYMLGSIISLYRWKRPIFYPC